MPTAVATVMVYPDKYRKDFNTIVAFLTQYLDKRGHTPSEKVASVAQTRSAKQQKTSTVCGTFKGKMI